MPAFPTFEISHAAGSSGTPGRKASAALQSLSAALMKAIRWALDHDSLSTGLLADATEDIVFANRFGKVLPVHVRDIQAWSIGPADGHRWTALAQSARA